MILFYSLLFYHLESEWELMDSVFSAAVLILKIGFNWRVGGKRYIEIG
jgi:hypothetical protein